MFKLGGSGDGESTFKVTDTFPHFSQIALWPLGYVSQVK